MSNPFPGMNPYRENPHHWRTVHNRFIAQIDSALNRTLPEGFATFVEDRVYVEGLNEVRETYLEIRTSDDREELIAAIGFTGDRRSGLCRWRDASFDALC